MQNLSRRGLHGTALEYAKLLLGLDPTDPRGILFCIDYLAIRAGQYKFLEVMLQPAKSSRRTADICDSWQDLCYVVCRGR